MDCVRPGSSWFGAIFAPNRELMSRLANIRAAKKRNLGSAGAESGPRGSRAYEFRKDTHTPVSVFGEKLQVGSAQ